MTMMKAAIRCGAWLLLLCALGCRAEFNETLTLRPLLGGSKVLAHFRFSISEASATDDGVFPKVLQQILSKYDAESLHLTFALGKHSDARYGPAQGVGSDALAHAPFGSRLQVRLRVSGDESIAESLSLQQRWRGITSELGGIFSASLNQMDLTVVTELLSSDGNPSALGAFPLENFNSGSKKSQQSSARFLHAGLAREETCTENLTPWLKMLPCRTHAGLGKLIDPIKYLSGEYLSLSLFASRSSTGGEWVLHQQLVTVQTLSAEERKRWSLKSVFFNSLPSDQSSLSACPLAKESVVYTETPTEGFELQHAPDKTAQRTSPSAAHASFGAPIVHSTSLKNKELSITDAWLTRTDSQIPAHESPKQDLVGVHRFVTGYGQVHGGIAVRLQNNHPQCAMRVTYHDVIPWYLRLYFNTFQAKASRGSLALPEERSLIQDFQFFPAEIRGRPNQLHLEMVLPANSSLVFSIQLDKAFLRLSEHPPDANRGFDVPSGVATFEPVVALDNSKEVCRELQRDTHAFTRTLFTEPLLVPLPTPDFSMPYNVITMTSTVVAFFVGSMLNTLLRKAPRIKQMMAKN